MAKNQQNKNQGAQKAKNTSNCSNCYNNSESGSRAKGQGTSGAKD